MNKYSELSNEELDRQIAERVMGWRPATDSEYDKYWEGFHCGEVENYFVPDDIKDGDLYLEHIKDYYFSADETTFFRDVVPRMLEKEFDWTATCAKEGDVWFYFGDTGVESNKGVARAGCESALMALDEMEGGNG